MFSPGFLRKQQRMNSITVYPWLVSKKRTADVSICGCFIVLWLLHIPFAYIRESSRIYLVNCPVATHQISGNDIECRQTSKNRMYHSARDHNRNESTHSDAPARLPVATASRGSIRRRPQCHTFYKIILMVLLCSAPSSGSFIV